ncbi:hypothetical protein [Bdellovibrio bacteriovorus]|uniref:hypothetical protein n=1 Tax=Bdellovibrio bacteriovorus TaxID=959 RepID=UPI0035A632B4
MDKSKIPKSTVNESKRFDFGGRASERKARASGYTNKEGKAVDLAKKDVPGSPTGALTDIGAGRSSAVRPSEKKNRH